MLAPPPVPFTVPVLWSCCVAGDDELSRAFVGMRRPTVSPMVYMRRAFAFTLHLLALEDADVDPAAPCALRTVSFPRREMDDDDDADEYEYESANDVLGVAPATSIAEPNEPDPGPDPEAEVEAEAEAEDLLLPAGVEGTALTTI